MASASLAERYHDRRPMPRRKPVVRDFRDYVPNVAILRFKPQPLKATDFRELFGKDLPVYKTAGQNITVIRTWMHQQGWPEMPHEFSIPEFASVFDRLFKGYDKRHAWQHFYQTDVSEARQYLANMASALLPMVMDNINSRTH